MIIASFFFVNKLEAKLSLNSHEYTVNQLKFATTLFRDFQKKYWFAATNICNQDRDNWVLIHGKKYLRPQVSLRHLENFSHKNKIWFTLELSISLYVYVAIFKRIIFLKRY